MYENRVGTVILTRSPADRPVPAGILTDRDIICAQIEHGADLSRLPASQQMTPDPLSVCEDTSIEDTLALMRSRDVRRAVVLDSSGGLAGLVSIDDIILRLAAEVTAIGRLLEAQAVHGV
jgi:CBS domain-containing protein